MDHYPIMDEDGNESYRVDQEFSWFRKILHVTDAEGNHLFTVRQIPFRLLPRFEVDFSDGSSLELRMRFQWMKTKIDVYPEHHGITVEGDVWGRKFDVLKNGESIGSVNKKMIAIADKFKIEIYDESQEELFIAIMIAVDTILDIKQRG